MQLTLHPCLETDFDAILALATADEIADYEGEPYAFFSRERLRLMVNSPDDTLFLVARAGESVAGFFLMLLHRASGLCYITDMVVGRDFQRLGIGERFVQEGLAFAERQSCEEVWCIVHEGNEAAWRMFEKAGFKKGKRFYFVGKMLGS